MPSMGDHGCKTDVLQGAGCPQQWAQYHSTQGSMDQGGTEDGQHVRLSVCENVTVDETRKGQNEARYFAQLVRCNKREQRKD